MEEQEPSSGRPVISHGIAEMFNSYIQKKTTKPSVMSYANVVSHNSGVLPTSDAVITDDGEYKSVKINQSAYEKRVQLCAHSLIGRLNLHKGEDPWILEDLKVALSKAWGTACNWRLISLGKGFYHVLLPSEELKQQVRCRGILGLKKGTFRVQPWTPDFDPFTQKTTIAQIWVRLYNLPWVYWDPIILSDIARCIGGLIRIDRKTLDGDYGHFARILVDVDMAGKLQKSVGIERDGRKFWIQLVYEDLPKFCKICSSVGHMAAHCKKNNESNHNEQSDQVVVSITSKFKHTQETKQKNMAAARRVDDLNCIDVGGGKVQVENMHHKTAPAPSKVWKPVEQKGNSIPVTGILKRINVDLQQKFQQRVLDHNSGKFIEMEDVDSSSDWSSSEDFVEFSNGPFPMVNWQVSTSYQRGSQPISVVFPDSPTQAEIHTQNPFELLSGLEENDDENVRITEIITNDDDLPKRIPWADLIGSDSEPEKIDTVDHLWRSNGIIQFAEHNRDANSDPEGWYTVRKKKYSPTPQMEPHVQVASKQSRNYFPVGTRKSKRQVRLPKKYQPS